jgi:hypothetical protein
MITMLLIHGNISTLLATFNLSIPLYSLISVTDLGSHFAPFGWSHFGPNTLVALIWIPSLLSALATELLMASTTSACGALPVRLF